MSLITIQDSLRQSVEAASGGAQTVLVTPKGQLTYMNVFNKFDMSTIDPSLSGTHPAFIINGVEKDKIYIGTYPGIIKNGEFVSQPNTNVAEGPSVATLLTAVRALGNGHHLCTYAEHSLLKMQAWASQKHVQGNTYFGRSGLDATQFGRRVDGASAVAGITTGIPKIFTGSGPVTFRHNNRYSGVSDVVGNRPEFSVGLRLVNTEIQVLENNNAAMSDAEILSSGNWKAIDGATGNLIMPDGNGTTPGSVRLRVTTTPATAEAYSLTVGSSSTETINITNASPMPIPQFVLNKLKAFGVLTLTNQYSRGYTSVNSSQNVVGYTHAGGSFAESASGIYQQSFSRPFSSSASPVDSARPCYYTP